MNIERVKEQIKNLKNEYQYDDFVLYYSNYKTTMDAINFNENELFGLINEQMSSSDITIFDEVNIFGELFEKYLLLEIDENKKLYSTKYSQIIFDFVVGNYFTENKYQDEILARSIMINSLKDFNLYIDFYPCGAGYSNIKFNSLYNINKEINIISL